MTSPESLYAREFDKLKPISDSFEAELNKIKLLIAPLKERESFILALQIDFYKLETLKDLGFFDDDDDDKVLIDVRNAHDKLQKELDGKGDDEFYNRYREILGPLKKIADIIESYPQELDKLKAISDDSLEAELNKIDLLISSLEERKSFIEDGASLIEIYKLENLKILDFFTNDDLAYVRHAHDVLQKKLDGKGDDEFYNGYRKILGILKKMVDIIESYLQANKADRHEFGKFIRQIRDDDTLKKNIEGLLPGKQLGEGSFGAVSSLGENFVVKNFPNTEENKSTYSKNVIFTLIHSRKDPNDTLNDFIVWSYDVVKDELMHESEKVIMELVCPLSKYNDTEHPTDLEFDNFYANLETWLNDCLSTLESHNLYCTDLKADNMGYVRTGDGYKFRLIDTDGLITGSIEDDFVSTIVRPSSLLYVSADHWVAWLKSVHELAKHLLLFEVKFNYKKAEESDLDILQDVFVNFVKSTAENAVIPPNSPMKIISLFEENWFGKVMVLKTSRFFEKLFDKLEEIPGVKLLDITLPCNIEFELRTPKRSGDEPVGSAPKKRQKGLQSKMLRKRGDDAAAFGARTA